MTLDNKRQELLDQLFAHRRKYKDARQFAKLETNKIRRIFYGLKKFGFSYILYNLSRFKFPPLFQSINSKLFFGRPMIWPAADLSAHVFSLYGILPHKSEIKLTSWLIKNLNDSDVFYDIGAHLGFYTALSEVIVSTGEIHAFEANRKLCQYLIRNFAKSTKVYIVDQALSDTPAKIDFYGVTATQDSSLGSRLNIGQTNVPIKVRATTLDEYVKVGHKPPTVIKLDIEGGEYEALLGAARVIEEYKPRIVMEVWRGFEGKKYSRRAVNKLKEFGYKAYALKSDGSVSDASVADPIGDSNNLSENSRDNFLFLAK